MPYIIQEHRALLDPQLFDISQNIVSQGELNYCITVLLHRYVKQKGITYSVLNDCLGVLDAAGKEFYRTIVAPYENKKIEENGDINVLINPEDEFQWGK